LDWNLGLKNLMMKQAACIYLCISYIIRKKLLDQTSPILHKDLPHAQKVFWGNVDPPQGPILLIAFLDGLSTHLLHPRASPSPT